MKTKIVTIIAAVIIISNNLFAAFTLDFLAKLGVVGSFTDLTGSVLEGRGDLILQLGYNFPIDKKLKGIDLLFDTGINFGSLSVKNNPSDKYSINQMDIIGINTGLACKFVVTPMFLPNAINTNQYAVYGLSVGAKFTPFIDGLNEKLNQVPISLYVNLSAERRIYTYDNRALVVGINLFYEYMFFNKNDVSKLFASRNINQHHSIGALISVGFHFGEN
ncbi:hypothetical protein WESB_1139 [Brachyspira pilosicoli WesB]|uniref:Outer membrane protein beta-barrel domain-containing protein n=1 Tax=Brachyspira pilosicoli WesB TaxID=1161918 RepID=K0JFK4_BRAPL|nr:hypothetical protein [Brachyspira pilosicoli]CCG56608.1 hypothetical protein WESB_1139 [Brachyspira pilosicoli WesB]